MSRVLQCDQILKQSKFLRNRTWEVIARQITEIHKFSRVYCSADTLIKIFSTLSYRILHLHDTPQVSKFSRYVTNKFIVAKISRIYWQESQTKRKMRNANDGRTHSFKRCSKPPTEEGIGPLISLHDISLQNNCLIFLW